MHYFPDMRYRDHLVDTRPSEGEGEVYWDRMFAEIVRCTLEVSLDLLTLVPGAKRHRDIQEVIVSLVNAIKWYLVGTLPVAEGISRRMSSGIRTIKECLLQFDSGTF